LYELGIGLEQDMDLAIHWYLRSAEQGSRKAQKRLDELGIAWNRSDAS
jgi:TPR repeat protein